MYIVLELMETDLSKVIYSKVPLTPEHVRFFLYQILRGCKAMHAKGVLHRDIKPANLLVNAQCDLKVCDFGLARIVEGESREQPDGLSTLTEYVVTRWYRAPEIMLCCDEYGPAIDVWAVGCVFGEMLLRKALFAGKDYLQQLRMIADGIDMPGMEQIEGFVKNEQAVAFLRKLPAAGNRLIVDRLQRAMDSGRGVEVDDEGVDLLLRMLAFDPRERISVDEAMAHPYLAELHGQRWPDEEEETEEENHDQAQEGPCTSAPKHGQEEEEGPAVEDDEEELGDSIGDDEVKPFNQSSSSESLASNSSNRSPREPAGDRASNAGVHSHGRRIVKKCTSSNKKQKPSLLDHEDFHFEKLGPIARPQLQDIFMEEIKRFHPELA